MAIMKREDLQKTEEYYYWIGYKDWRAFPEELKAKLLSVYGKEPYPHKWTNQDIYEGSRKLITEYFKSSSN